MVSPKSVALKNGLHRIEELCAVMLEKLEELGTEESEEMMELVNDILYVTQDAVYNVE